MRRPAHLTVILGVLGLVGTLAILWMIVRGPAGSRESELSAHRDVSVDVRPELVRLPGGRFVMGSPEGEGSADERPRREVTVSPFAMCRTEVSNDQYRAITGQSPSDCTYGCDGDHPVQGVSWEAAVRYLNALTARENARRAGEEGEAPLTLCYDEDTRAWDRSCTGYRLPTEAEWEYAARAGGAAAYWFGEDPKDLCQYANVLDLRGAAKHGAGYPVECDDGFVDLAPVTGGGLRASPWGLQAMYGNVSEWVFDVYRPNYEGLPTVDPARDIASERDRFTAHRVLRGGAFDDGAEVVRAANREAFGAVSRSWFIGFRCARGPIPEP